MGGYLQFTDLQVMSEVFNTDLGGSLKSDIITIDLFFGGIPKLKQLSYFK